MISMELGIRPSDVFQQCIRPYIQQNVASNNKSTKNINTNIKREIQEVEDTWMSEYKKSFNKTKTCRGTNSCSWVERTMFEHNLKPAMTGHNHGNACKVCGETDYFTCGICGVDLDIISNIDQQSGLTVFF